MQISSVSAAENIKIDIFETLKYTYNEDNLGKFLNL